MKEDLRIKAHPILSINRGDPVEFRFNGRPVLAYTGETVAAALYAAGVRTFSRSFKYHRRRGLFCLCGHCSHCLMRVDGLPNVRICQELVKAGIQVESQNAWPSLNFDIKALTGLLDFLVRPGFQYRRFIRHRGLYHLWEKFLRRMAGIGSLADTEGQIAVSRHQAEPEVVVVGAGIAGLSAALHAALGGSEVWLIEKQQALGGRLLYDTAAYELPAVQVKQWGFALVAHIANQLEQLKNCRIFKRATAFAWYDEGILAVTRPAEFWELRPKQVIVATGSYEIPLLFENNDLPGIFLAGALQRLMHRDYIRPGRHAVVATVDDRGYDLAHQLLAAGVSITAVVDHRRQNQVYASDAAQSIMQANIDVYPQHSIKAASGRGHIKAVIITPLRRPNHAGSVSEKKLSCDVLCMSGSRMPANDLIFQKTCHGTYILESPHQFTRKPVFSKHMMVDNTMFVAGEAAGSQGIERLWLEGKIAGLSAALSLGYGDFKIESQRDAAVETLEARWI
jgi:sarcosine oxidase subunit alpha